MPVIDVSSSIAHDRVLAVESRVRELFSKRVEWPEPDLRLDLGRRGDDPSRQVKHLHQMCNGLAVSFRIQSQITLGYLCQAYLGAATSGNPLSVFQAARAILETHAWMFYVARKLGEFSDSSPDGWRAAGDSFFDILVRAKYGTSDEGKKRVLAKAREDFDFKPIQVMTCLDHLSRTEGFEWAREHYERLCDYVHPNLGSHTVGVTGIRSGVFEMKVPGGIARHKSDAIQQFEYPSTVWPRFATEFTLEHASASAEGLWNVLQEMPTSPYSATFLEEMTGRPDALGVVDPAMPMKRGTTESLATPKVGRNQMCPCQSGKKFKRCCGP